MKFIDAAGDDTELSAMLKKLIEALKCVPVSNVVVERLFSASGCFVTKLRSRIGDAMIDSLCVLRSYFQRAPKQTRNFIVQNLID